jgi:hypothetical protein
LASRSFRHSLDRIVSLPTIFRSSNDGCQIKCEYLTHPPPLLPQDRVSDLGPHYLLYEIGISSCHGLRKLIPLLSASFQLTLWLSAGVVLQKSLPPPTSGVSPEPFLPSQTIDISPGLHVSPLLLLSLMTRSGNLWRLITCAPSSGAKQPECSPFSRRRRSLGETRRSFSRNYWTVLSTACSVLRI